jgi:group I intron endonuclease
MATHKNMLKREACCKDCNRHLYNAVKKYGIKNFAFEILEQGIFESDATLSDRELYWMDKLNSCDRNYGYNLRRDSSTTTEVHQETRDIFREMFIGKNNPNYGRRWTKEMKSRMSTDAKSRHNAGKYGEDWKSKISIASKKMWSNPEKRKQVSNSVSKAKEKYKFLQYKDGLLIRTWESVKEIVSENPNYKWQNIYSVCNGYKHTYMGFIWKKIPKR